MDCSRLPQPTEAAVRVRATVGINMFQKGRCGCAKRSVSISHRWSLGATVQYISWFKRPQRWWERLTVMMREMPGHSHLMLCPRNGPSSRWTRPGRSGGPVAHSEPREHQRRRAASCPGSKNRFNQRGVEQRNIYRLPSGALRGRGNAGWWRPPPPVHDRWAGSHRQIRYIQALWRTSRLHSGSFSLHWTGKTGLDHSSGKLWVVQLPRLFLAAANRNHVNRRHDGAPGAPVDPYSHILRRRPGCHEGWHHTRCNHKRPVSRHQETRQNYIKAPGQPIAD